MKRAKAVHKTAVLAIVRHEGEKATRATGISVHPREWDKKREKVRDDEKANRKLEELSKRILQLIEALQRIPTKEEIKQAKEPGKKARKTITAAIYEKAVEAKQIRQGKHSDRAFISVGTNVKLFILEKKRAEVYLDQINTEWIADFIGWLNSRGLASSTVTKNVKSIISVLKRFGSQDQYSNVNAPKPEHGDKVFLTLDEINLLENMELEKDSTEDLVRDWFLCGLYTGLRFCDWDKINTKYMDRVDGCLMLWPSQQKTKSKAVIPVNPKLLQILEKHGGALKPLSNQFINRTIKDICQQAGITEPTTINKHRQGKVETSIYPKNELVSCHTCRRTFATHALDMGIPPEDAKRLTGHTSIESLLKYDRRKIEETVKKYRNHPLFK